MEGHVLTIVRVEDRGADHPLVGWETRGRDEDPGHVRLDPGLWEFRQQPLVVPQRILKPLEVRGELGELLVELWLMQDAHTTRTYQARRLDPLPRLVPSPRVPFGRPRKPTRRGWRTPSPAPTRESIPGIR